MKSGRWIRNGERWTVEGKHSTYAAKVTTMNKLAAGYQSNLHEPVSSNEVQTSRIIDDSVDQEHTIAPCQPQVRAIAKRESLFVNIQERLKQTELGNSAPTNHPPSFVSRNELNKEKSADSKNETMISRTQQPVSEKSTGDNHIYPSFISLPSRQNNDIALLFAHTESAYVSKEYGVLINQLKSNMGKCFSKIKAEFLNARKDELAFLKAECEQYAVQAAMKNSTKVDKKKPNCPMLFFRVMPEFQAIHILRNIASMLQFRLWLSCLR